MAEDNRELVVYRHILVPTDGSPIAQKAVLDGIRLASALGARVTILTVLEPFYSLGDRGHAYAGVPESVRQQALDFLNLESRKALDHALSCAAVRQVAADAVMVEAALVHEAIIAEARKRSVDLIVMGSHGRRGAAVLVLGSVAQKVLAHGTLPVLVVR